MKKIGLFLGATPYSGGSVQYNLSALEAVASLTSWEFSTVVAYDSDFWEKRLEHFASKKISIPRGFWRRVFGYSLRLVGLPVAFRRRISPYFHPMARTLLNERCDLWIFPSQDGWGFEIPVPALVTIYDLMHRYERRFPEVSAGGEYRRREFAFRNICKWAKGVIVDSQVGKEHVMESYGLEADRLHVLPYIAPAYMYSSEMPVGFDTRYNLPAKYIFYPAQFWEHKNHKRLIEAAGKLKRTIPDLKLVFAGSKKNAYKSVLQLAKALNLTDDVILLGYVPDEDMPEIYRRARALVMPTFFGPTNIPPLEAFAIGCPVAISNVYGMPEQVGEAALLFDPGSVREIAECVRRLWIDDRLCVELAEKGRQRAVRWGQKQFSERLKDIIAQVLSRG